jgi:hypothetical protein
MMRSPAFGCRSRKRSKSAIVISIAAAEASASTSADRVGSISAISPKAMPAVSVASRTPSGSVICTAPLRRKKIEVAGAPAETIVSPAL